jgi:rubredoxin
MEKWECQVCGYVYDEEKGDPDHGVEPKTKFGGLPADWICPVCGAPKGQFKKL